ncbi:hypothetical protein HZH68_010344 [Vespula germanica]|uniref:Uncharacterized protein n=1 Tax=Vespula germanica TaxID=30212 RepID=A0A834N1S9_VESGE|nr:hypothetical protein HZH68_010344 [Vespula germanica]
MARKILLPQAEILSTIKSPNICFSVQFTRKMRSLIGTHDVKRGGTRILAVTRSVIKSSSKLKYQLNHRVFPQTEFLISITSHLPPHLLPFPSSSVDLVDQACRSCNCRGLSRPQLPISSGDRAAVAAAAAASTRILGIPRSSSFLDQRATGGSDVDVAIKPAKIGQ